MKVLYYVEKELTQLPHAKMAALQRKPADCETGRVTVSVSHCVSLACMVCVH